MNHITGEMEFLEEGDWIPFALAKHQYTAKDDHYHVCINANNGRFVCAYIPPPGV
jgi:hypothetical protein